MSGLQARLPGPVVCRRLVRRAVVSPPTLRRNLWVWWLQRSLLPGVSPPACCSARRVSQVWAGPNSRGPLRPAGP